MRSVCAVIDLLSIERMVDVVVSVVGGVVVVIVVVIAVVLVVEAVCCCVDCSFISARES